MTKLKSKDLAQWKKDALLKQGFICPFCGGSLRGIPLSKLAADHCHETGYLRAVLHMSCNRAEGILLKALSTWAKCGTIAKRVQALKNLAEYWEYHRNNPSGLTYPTHKTKEQIKELKLKQARLASKRRAQSNKGNTK